MKNTNLIAGLLILVGVVGVGYYYMNGQKQNTANVIPVTQIPSSQSSPAISSGASTTVMNEIKVEAGSFYYKPNTMDVKMGEKVRIVMNSVSMMHDFNIDELNVHMPIIKNGDTGTVEFTADKLGTFEYYCSVGQHRANGQVGTITVK